MNQFHEMTRKQIKIKLTFFNQTGSALYILAIHMLLKKKSIPSTPGIESRYDFIDSPDRLIAI